MQKNQSKAFVFNPQALKGQTFNYRSIKENFFYDPKKEKDHQFGEAEMFDRIMGNTQVKNSVTTIYKDPKLVNQYIPSKMIPEWPHKGAYNYFYNAAYSRNRTSVNIGGTFQQYFKPNEQLTAQRNLKSKLRKEIHPYFSQKELLTQFKAHVIFRGNDKPVMSSEYSFPQNGTNAYDNLKVLHDHLIRYENQLRGIHSFREHLHSYNSLVICYHSSFLSEKLIESEWEIRLCIYEIKEKIFQIQLQYYNYL